MNKLNLHSFGMVLLFPFFFTSCNSWSLLKVENFTQQDVIIRCYLFVEPDNDSIKIRKLIFPPGPHNIHWSDVDNSWSDKRIENLVYRIQKIEIETFKQSTILEGREELFQYFKKHRKSTLFNFRKQMLIKIQE